MTQDRLKHLLSEEMKKPIQKGKPLELSTEASTSPVSDTSAKAHHRTIAPTEQYKRVNRGYKLREDLIKDCKRRALDEDKMLYEVMEEALTAFLEGAITAERGRKIRAEIEALMRRLALEEREHFEDLDHEKRFREDTQVRQFKKWLRSHGQPQDSTFAQRFLADGQLPEHASRGMYEAKMRTVTAVYSDEDLHQFQDAWKSMLFSEDVQDVPSSYRDHHLLP